MQVMYAFPCSEIQNRYSVSTEVRAMKTNFSNSPNGHWFETFFCFFAGHYMKRRIFFFTPNHVLRINIWWYQDNKSLAARWPANVTPGKFKCLSKEMNYSYKNRQVSGLYLWLWLWYLRRLVKLIDVVILEVCNSRQENVQISSYCYELRPENNVR